MKAASLRSYWPVTVLACASLALSTVCASLAQSSSPSSQQMKFRSGDGVRVVVWWDIGAETNSKLQNLGESTDYLIDSDGNIQMPLLGEVKVAGHTPLSFAEAVQTSLQIHKIRRVVCMPLIRVAVMGAINRPGSYLIRPQESLWDLVNQAGGPANGAVVQKIRLERGGRKIKNDLMTEGFESAYSLERIGVRSGDQVIVPAKSRVSVGEILSFASFGMSVAVFYLQVSDNR